MAHSPSSRAASLSRQSSDNMATAAATTREFVASPVTRNRFILRATTVTSSTGDPVHASRHTTTTAVVTSGGEERHKSRPTTTSAAYFAPDESSCSFVDFSSTINTVLPTLRRSVPVTTQSRHFSLFDGGESSSDGGHLPPAEQQSSATPVHIDPAPPANEFMRRVSSYSSRSLISALPTPHVAGVSTSRSAGNVIAVAAASQSTSAIGTSTAAVTLSSSATTSPDASSANATTNTTTSSSFHFGYHVPLETGHIQVNLRKHESERTHQVTIMNNSTNGRQRVDGTHWSTGEVALRHPPPAAPAQRGAGTAGGASASDDGGSSAVFVQAKPSSASSVTSTHRSTSPLLRSPTRSGLASGSAASDHFDFEPSRTASWRQRSSSAASGTRSVHSPTNDRLVRNALDEENVTKSGWTTSSEWAEKDENMKLAVPHSQSLRSLSPSKPGVEESSVAASVDMQRRSSQYLGELVWQVDEMVFCGGIEAAQNQNLLCRLNIEYIVDLSSQDDDPDLINRPRSECPCLCPKRTAHSRVIMAIRIRDDSDDVTSSTDAGNATHGSSGSALLAVGGGSSVGSSKEQFREREEIIRCFEMLIDLIRKARIRQKKVLIQSLKGRNRAPAFVAAYLMHCNRCTRVEALAKISKMVSKTRPGMCISDRLQRALMRWQSVLGIRSDDAAARLDANSITKIFAVKKSAWS